jgi:hypothetical protein
MSYKKLYKLIAVTKKLNRLVSLLEAKFISPLTTILSPSPFPFTLYPSNPMYSKILLTSILFSISFIPNVTPAAHAIGCVNADISSQVKITGSKDTPGVQKNTVNQAIDPTTCIGNMNIHKSTQFYVGAEGVDQIRNSNQYSAGSGHNGLIPSSVMDKGNVTVRVGTATTVYNPALDPNFLPKK